MRKKEAPPQIAKKEGMEGVAEIVNVLKTERSWQELMSTRDHGDMLIAALANRIAGISREDLGELNAILSEWYKE